MKTHKLKLWTFALILLWVFTAKAQEATQNYPRKTYKTVIQENTTRITDLENQLATAKTTALIQKETITVLKSKLVASQARLQAASAEKTTIAVFGTTMEKATFSGLLSIFVGIMLLVSAVFAFRFRSANAITRSAKTCLANVEEEYEEHIRKSLEREQKLRRQLQDEINKNKLSDAS